MLQYWGPLVCMGLLFGCSAEEPTATKLKRQMEGSAGVSGDASKKVLVGWNDPIDSTKFGLAPNPKIDGKTLAQVVTSQVAGRDDGQLCSACHNANDAQGGYGPGAAKNAASPTLKPTDTVSNRTWVGSGGWAERFVKNSTKPANVKAVVQAWIDNNYK